MSYRLSPESPFRLKVPLSRLLVGKIPLRALLTCFGVWRQSHDVAGLELSILLPQLPKRTKCDHFEGFLFT